jgi:hypothetical protein
MNSEYKLSEWLKFSRTIQQAIHKWNEEQKKFLNTKGTMAFRHESMMGL